MNPELHQDITLSPDEKSAGFAAVMQRLKSRSSDERARLRAHADAAVLGHEAYALGHEYLRRGDYVAAKRWLRVAADHSVPGTEQALEEIEMRQPREGLADMAAVGICADDASCTTNPSRPVAFVDAEAIKGVQTWMSVKDHPAARQVTVAAQAEAKQITEQAHGAADALLSEAQQQAQAVIDEARQQAQTLIEEAQARAAQIGAEVRQQGGASEWKPVRVLEAGLDEACAGSWQALMYAAQEACSRASDDLWECSAAESTECAGADPEPGRRLVWAPSTRREIAAALWVASIGEAGTVRRRDDRRSWQGDIPEALYVAVRLGRDLHTLERNEWWARLKRITRWCYESRGNEASSAIAASEMNWGDRVLTVLWVDADCDGDEEENSASGTLDAEGAAHATGR
ncbi:hypothetical protein HUT19_40865 [Streptomyces sp. NA02950]|uniref:hypothetical protein n=1 Tax=Streptomyces sp. NA02950 TaxID=2742137 RepID=UPI00159112F8|nr:hypothetical protein [Streptomyces sp. NA02950]QKV90429.1 hypothetical protein HUT19_00355 [Streptomyces sp. NA02950]QKV97238.1 hypothetical protein HUT19_40865 [Streptomyces sp. NA02950]